MASHSSAGSASTLAGSRITGRRHPYVTGPGTESLAYQRAASKVNGSGGLASRLACFRYRRSLTNPAATHSSRSAAPAAIAQSQYSCRQCALDNAATGAAAVVPELTETESTSTGGVLHGSITGSSSNTTRSPCHIRKRALAFVSVSAASPAAAVSTNTCSLQVISVVSI